MLEQSKSNHSPFAKNKLGQIVDVDQVPRGEACQCFCIKCGKPLLAKKGEVNVHHFAHKPVEVEMPGNLMDCTGALESALHAAAKQLIEAEGGLYIPDLLRSKEGVSRTIPGGLQKFRIVELEKTIAQDEKYIRPDVMTIFGEEQLAIEIVVTNPVSPSKIDFYEKKGISCVQIDLRSLRDE